MQLLIASSDCNMFKIKIKISIPSLLVDLAVSVLSVSMESYDKLRREFDDYVETSREIEAELERSLQDAEKLGADLSKKKAVLEEKVALLQEKVAANARESNAKQAELDQAKERLEHAVAVKAQLESSNDELEEKLRRMQSTEEDLLHKLEVAEENCILLQGDIVDLKVTSKEATFTIEDNSASATLNQELIEHREMAEILEVELEELRQQHGDLEKRNNELNDELSRLTDELVTSHETTVAIQARLDGEIGARHALEADKKALQELLLDEKSASALSIEELQREITLLKSDIENYRSSSDDAQQHLESISKMQSELEVSRSEIKRSIVEKDGLLEKISALSEETRALSSEKAQLQMQAAGTSDAPSNELCAKLVEVSKLNEALVSKDAELSLLQAELLARRTAEMVLVNKSSELNDTISELEALLAAAHTPAQAKIAEELYDDTREEIIRALEEKVFELTTRVESFDKQSPRKLSKAAYTANMIHQEEEKKTLRETIGRLERELITYRNSLREVKKLDEKTKDGTAVSAVNFGVSSIRASVEQVIASGDYCAVRDELLRQLDRHDMVRRSNARLLQKIQAVTGNIQVCCRTRPMSDLEATNHEKMCIDVIDDCELVCFDRRADQWRSFVFDRAFHKDASQADVFSDIEPIVLSVVEGFNTCLLAYGQTGSGKTYTMNGLSEEWGVAYRTMQKIFETLYLKKAQSEEQLARLRECRAGGSSNGSNAASLDDSILSQSEPFCFSVSVSMMEIYNDQVFDLLDSGGRGLEIRQSPEGGVYVPGLRQMPVACLDDVMKVFATGSANRATGATNINEHSSRSHSVLQVDVCTTAAGAIPLKSKLFLVDLAGSERVGKSGVTGAAMKEAQHINKSLSALGDVMEALDQKAKHVPYRNSKLTYLLQDALGGNSRTMMVVTICPTENFVDETLFTLQFATRIRNISLGSAKKNVNNKNLEEALKTIKSELRDIKKRKTLSDETVNELRRENKRLGEKIATSLEHKQRSADEAKKSVEVHVQQLIKGNQDLGAKYNDEREARAHLSQELDTTRTALRRAQEQAREATRERDKLFLALKQKEIESGQTSRLTAVSAPQPAYGSTSSWKSAFATTSHSGGIPASYAHRAQATARQKSSPAAEPPVGVDGGDGSGAGLASDAHSPTGDAKKYGSRLRLSHATHSLSDSLNCSAVLKPTKTSSHRHSIDNSAVPTAAAAGTAAGTAAATSTAPSTAASACSSRAREALMRHQERLQAHREKLSAKRPSQFPA